MVMIVKVTMIVKEYLGGNKWIKKISKTTTATTTNNQNYNKINRLK